MKIKNLNEQEKSGLKNLLKEDGFLKVSFESNCVSFQKGIRKYKLYSFGFDEDSLEIDFDFDVFMENNYEEKTRHSISFSDKFYTTGSIAESCKKLGWKILKGPISISNDSSWKVEMYAAMITEVLVGKVIHTIIDDRVFAGEAEDLLYMGRVDSQTLLSGTRLYQKIREHL